MLQARPSSRTNESRARCALSLAVALAIAPAYAIPSTTAGQHDVARSHLEGRFFEEINVDVLTVTARVVDSFGRPLPDLRPEDLVATIDGREFPVAEVDWQGPPFAVGASTRVSDALPRKALSDSTASPVESASPGRLAVLFLQNDFEPSRVTGQMKLFPELRRMVDNLGPSDRVAVLSFHAHLELWQDFTTDKSAVQASLGKAFYPGARPDSIESAGEPSLLDFFSVESARAIAKSVEALQYTADALAAIPGEKDLIFVGYGLEGGGARRMQSTLREARITIFVLDTTQADFHTLEVGLMKMAEETGGTYASSYEFAARAVREIERTIRGHYLITIDRSRVPEVSGKVRIRLSGRPGTVLMRRTRSR